MKSKDIDYAVECSSFEEMEQTIVDMGGEIFLSTPEYFTVRAKVPELGIADYVLCRKDGTYSDGRRPDFVEPGTIEDDLARRDFTINAIAIDESGNYIDPYNGLADIHRKVIKCVGHAADRFTEDSLRMLRAIRFAITKDFIIDTSIHTYIQCWGGEIVRVSKDRIREELQKCFKHNTLRTISLLNQYPKLFRAVFDQNIIWLNPTMKSV